MHTLEFDGLRREIPSSWNELSRSQLLFLSSEFSKGIPVKEFKMKLLFHFLQVKWKKFARLGPENLYFAGEKLNFLLEKVALTKNLLPVLRCGIFRHRCFYGPADGMKFSTFEEFIHVQVRFEAMAGNNDENSLDELIACLYRQRKAFWPLRRRFSKSEDGRKGFSLRTVTRRARLISRLDPEIKLAVLLFVIGVLNALPEYFPNIYRSKPELPVAGWPSLVVSLADGRTDDRSLERVLNSNMYNVLLGLDQRAREYYEFLEKMDK